MLPQFALRLSRSLSRCGIAAALLAGLAATAPSLAHAQEFLSIQANTVNIRAKPNTKAAVAWELIKGYPVQVTARQGEWLKVKDFEGTLGWVHKPLTTDVPHFLIKGHSVNLRAGPGKKYRVVTKLHKYDIVKTLEKRDKWAKVQTDDGKTGWMLKSLGWGW